MSARPRRVLRPDRRCTVVCQRNRIAVGRSYLPAAFESLPTQACQCRRAERALASLCLAPILCAIALASHSAGAEVFVPEWRKSARCGTNALYALVRLSGHSVRYSDVSKLVPVTDHGTSIDALRSAALELGLTLHVRRIVAEELMQLPCPFILHLDQSDGGGGGHFVTVRLTLEDKEHGSVYFVDGTTGLETLASARQLTDEMSGIVLVPDTAVWVGGGVDWWLISLVIVIGIQLLIIWTLYRK